MNRQQLVLEVRGTGLAMATALLFACGGGGASVGQDGEGESEAEAESEGCSPQNCDDGVACTDDTAAGPDCACTHQPLHGRCPRGQVCDATHGCASPPPCAMPSDCPDLDGPCLQESCDTASATCEYAPLDADGDGHPPQICRSVAGDDCDDGDPSVHPGATEVCDGKDNDCDGSVDGMMQACGTSVGVCIPGTQVCTSGTWGPCTGGVRPAPERCNGLDDNCDGAIDEEVTSLFYRDSDGDSFGDPNDEVAVCAAPPGFVPDNTDCDDSHATVHPGAPELCDSLDNDCNGEVDEPFPMLGMDCVVGEGLCASDGLYACSDDMLGDVCVITFPGASPTVEVCTGGQDEDCDGLTDCEDPDCPDGTACSEMYPISCSRGSCGSCGDGVCDRSDGRRYVGSESCDTDARPWDTTKCAADCGNCCGDGVCNESDGDHCNVCDIDCGICPVCGDGICEGWPRECHDWCPWDCGVNRPCSP